MIESRYNYYTPQDGKILCFNGVTGSVFSLNQNDFFFMKKLMYDIGLQGLYPELTHKLEKAHFLVNSINDEISYLRGRFRSFQNNGIWHLIINPTQNCNFNCWYCYEKHPQSKMTVDIIERIKRLIDNILYREKGKGLILGWFGGEPLLYFNEIVYPISLYAKKRTDELGLSFSCSMTTNGFLLKKSIIQKSIDIQLDLFQITLDGNREMHNKVRNQSGKPSFDRILQNCIALLRSSSQKQIQLRINYTTQTIQENFSNILDSVPFDVRSRLRIQFQRVWQTYEKEGDDDKVKVILNENLDKLRERGFQISFNTSYNIFRGILCYADRKNYVHINYDGRIYRCTARDYTADNALGYINKEGEIIWENHSLKDFGKRALFDNPLCLDCKYLPVCGGPCFSKWIEIFKDRKLIECPLKKMKSDLGLSDFIKKHYIESKRKNIMHISKKIDILE